MSERTVGQCLYQPCKNICQAVVKDWLRRHCEECKMWRLFLSKQRLFTSEREKLEEILNDFSFTCVGLCTSRFSNGEKFNTHLESL